MNEEEAKIHCSKIKGKCDICQVCPCGWQACKVGQKRQRKIDAEAKKHLDNIHNRIAENTARLHYEYMEDKADKIKDWFPEKGMFHDVLDAFSTREWLGRSLRNNPDMTIRAADIYLEATTYIMSDDQGRKFKNMSYQLIECEQGGKK